MDKQLKNVLLMADSVKGRGIGACPTLEGIIVLRCRTRQELISKLKDTCAAALLLKITSRGEFTPAFIKEIRQAYHGMPVIVLGSASFELKARQAGVTAFFTDCSDPFFRRVVLGIMIKILGKKTKIKGGTVHESTCCG